MFNIGSIIGDALNSLDSVAKETLEGNNIFVKNILITFYLLLKFLMSR